MIEHVKGLVPGKPIRFVVNSHQHFDHAGGVRAAVAEGATIVTQADNVPYFERAFAQPNRIRPDAHGAVRPDGPPSSAVPEQARHRRRAAGRSRCTASSAARTATAS